MRVTGDSLPRP